MRYLIILLAAGLYSCGASQSIYIVRHAEKQQAGTGVMMVDAGDPPLSEAGRERALALRDSLRDKGITHIFSTRYIRTIQTAKPLSEVNGNLPIQLYSAKLDSMDAFINQLKSIRRGNILIVGHSNTIDDLANKLCGTTVVAGDLEDKMYDNLFEIIRKRDRYLFKGRKYGVRTE